MIPASGIKMKTLDNISVFEQCFPSRLAMRQRNLPLHDQLHIKAAVCRIGGRLTSASSPVAGERLSATQAGCHRLPAACRPTAAAHPRGELSPTVTGELSPTVTCPTPGVCCGTAGHSRSAERQTGHGGPRVTQIRYISSGQVLPTNQACEERSTLAWRQIRFVT